MSDTYDLHITQNATFELTFSDGVTDFRNYTIASQARVKESNSSTLLLDLSPYFTASTDGLSVTLRVPATITAGLAASSFPAEGGPKKPAKWDMFLIDKNDPTNSELYLQGDAYCDPATTKIEVTA